MNGRTFIFALALVAALGIWTSAQQSRPVDGPMDDLRGAGLGMQLDGPLGPPGPSPEATPPERIAYWMEQIRQAWPDQHRRLLALQDHQPREFQRVLWRTVQMMQESAGLTPELRETFIRVHSDNVRVAELVRRHNAARDDAVRARLRREIESAVASQFDDIQALRRHRLDQFAQRLQELRDELDTRQSNRHQVIQTRVEDLLTGQDRRLW